MKRSTLLVSMILAFGFISAQNSFTCDFIDTVNTGPENSIIIFSGSCINNDCCNSVSITQIIVSSSLPAGWQISMCNPNGCFGIGVDTNAFVLGGSASGGVYFEIHAGAGAETGTATVRFENTANPSDYAEFTIMATTYPSAVEVTLAENDDLSQNVPNPFTLSTAIKYKLKGGNGRLIISDIIGNIVRQYHLQGQTGRFFLNEQLPQGTYFYALWEQGVLADRKKMIVVK